MFEKTNIKLLVSAPLEKNVFDATRLSGKVSVSQLEGCVFDPRLLSDSP